MPTSEYEKMRRRYPVQVERFCRACPNYMLQLGWDGTRYCDACGWHGLHAALARDGKVLHVPCELCSVSTE